MHVKLLLTVPYIARYCHRVLPKAPTIIPSPLPTNTLDTVVFSDGPDSLTRQVTKL